MSAGARAVFRSALLSLRRMEYRLGCTNERDAKLHHSRFMGVFFSLDPTYFISGILLPFFHGSWRFTVYHFLVGPQLAILLTTNPNEVAAIWSYLSIGILLLVVKTPIRRSVRRGNSSQLLTRGLT